jgi:hypothetical protein
VIDRFRAGITIAGVIERLERWMDDARAREQIEAAVVELLEGDVDSPAVERASP